MRVAYLFLIVCSVFISCGSEEDKFLGEWNYEREARTEVFGLELDEGDTSGTIIFSEDSTGKWNAYRPYDIEWEIVDDGSSISILKKIDNEIVFPFSLKRTFDIEHLSSGKIRLTHQSFSVSTFDLTQEKETYEEILLSRN